MRLYEIRMEGFRGYPACLPLKLDYDVVVIFGDNGSGKSSLFNAIEWLLEDKVDLGDTRDAGRGDRFRNIFTNCEEPWAQLTFLRKEQSRTKKYQITRRLKAGTIQSSSIIPKDELLQTDSYPDQLLSREALETRMIPYEWPLTYGQGDFEQVFLNRKRLAKFIEVKSSDRGTQLSKLLGYGVFEEYEKIISKLLGFIKDHRRKQRLEDRFRDCCTNFSLNAFAESYQANFGTLPSAIQILLTPVNELIEEAKESINDDKPFYFEGLLDLWKEQLQQLQVSLSLTDEEQAQATIKLESARETLKKQQDLSDFFRADTQWLNPTEYQLDAVQKHSEIKQRLDELPDLFQKVGKFQDDPDKFELEQKLSFLEYGLQRISEQDTCPFCQQSVTGFREDSQTTVKEHIVRHHQDFLTQYQDYNPVHDVLEELRKTRQLLQYINCENNIKQYQQTLKAHFESLKTHARTLTEDEISSPELDVFLSQVYDFSTTQSLLNIIDNALQFLEKPEENKSFALPNDLSRRIETSLQLGEQLNQTQQNITKIIKEMNSHYQEARTIFTNKQQDGLEDEVHRLKKWKAQFNLLNDLMGLEDQITNLEEATRKLSSINKYIQALLEGRSILRRAKETLLQEAIDRISERVNEIYVNMNPDEALNQIKFRSSGEGNVDIIIDDRNTDIGDKDPRPQAFLSEGHLNCLGIAIHLALQEIIDSPYGFVIFDDPIYSIDAGHRIRALDEMFDFAKKTGKQLIIATHDPLFFHYLKEGLRLRHNEIDSRQIYIVANHSSTQPYIVEESSNASFLDEAKEKLSHGCTSYELETAYVFLRRELEYMCNKLLEGQRIAVYGESYEKLESRLDLLKELEDIDDNDVNKLQMVRKICNPAAHYDPHGRETHTVAQQVIKDIEEFWDKYKHLQKSQQKRRGFSQ